MLGPQDPTTMQIISICSFLDQMYSKSKDLAAHKGECQNHLLFLIIANIDIYNAM